MKIAVIVFVISNVLAFILVAFKNQYAVLIPLMFLYAIATIALFLLNYFGINFLKIDINYIHPIAFIISFLMLEYAVSWFSGNNFYHTLQSFITDRKKIFAMEDPYIIANIVTYILILKRNSFLD